jgi:hypothetical protein
MKKENTNMLTLTDNMRITTDKAIIIDERLMASPLGNSFHNLLLKNHDVYYFNMKDYNYPDLSCIQIQKSVYDTFQVGYKTITFIGYKESCELFYSLYNLKSFVFDSVILIEPKKENIRLFKRLKGKTDFILCITKERYNAFYEDKFYNYATQSLKTLLPFTHSPRLAKEVLGWLTCGVYGQTYLNDPHGELHRLS